MLISHHDNAISKYFEIWRSRVSLLLVLSLCTWLWMSQPTFQSYFKMLTRMPFLIPFDNSFGEVCFTAHGHLPAPCQQYCLLLLLRAPEVPRSLLRNASNEKKRRLAYTCITAVQHVSGKEQNKQGTSTWFSKYVLSWWLISTMANTVEITSRANIGEVCLRAYARVMEMMTWTLYYVFCAHTQTRIFHQDRRVLSKKV